MRIYLDEDPSSALLVALLRKAGHQVMLCVDAGMTGKADPENSFMPFSKITSY